MTANPLTTEPTPAIFIAPELFASASFAEVLAARTRQEASQAHALGVAMPGSFTAMLGERLRDRALRHANAEERALCSQAAEPATASAVEPAREHAIEPTGPAAASATELPTHSTVASPEASAAEPAAEQAMEAVPSPAVKPAGKRARKIATAPATQPAAKNAGKMAAKSAKRSAGKPADRTGAASAKASAGTDARATAEAPAKDARRKSSKVALAREPAAKPAQEPVAESRVEPVTGTTIELATQLATEPVSKDPRRRAAEPAEAITSAPPPLEQAGVSDLDPAALFHEAAPHVAAEAAAALQAPKWRLYAAQLWGAALEFSRRLAPAQRSARKMRVVESVSLGEKRFAAVLDVDGQRFLIGGGAGTVALLTALDQSSPGAEAAQAPGAIIS